MINVTQTFLPPVEEYTAFLERIWSVRWLTNRGPLAFELETVLKDYLGIDDLLAVSNGTIALQLAIKALGLKGEIITTPFSFVATVSSIVWENCVPRFVDINPDYLTIDVTQIEASITEKTSAILATHVYGNPCDVEAIQVIADRHNLKVIYDAAHCFGVKYKGRSILKWGDVSTLSFHATKLFHTGEGGAVISNDRQLGHEVFYHHNFGLDGPEAFFGLGINAKISELSAAMGLAVFPYVEKIIDRRRRISEQYDALLIQSDLRKPLLRENTELTYTYYPVIFPDQERLLRAQKDLNAELIFPRRYFYPSLNKLPYVEDQSMPVAESISERILCLPSYFELDTGSIEKISYIIHKACD